MIPIETTRLVLLEFDYQRHLTPEYVRWLNTPETVAYSEQRHHPQSKASCQEYLDSMKAAGNHVLAIEIKNLNRHIGNIGIQYDRINGLADVSILLGDEDTRGKGYGIEAWKAVINWLSDRQEVRKITAGTMALNKPMVCLMKGAGMLPDGVRKDHYLKDGKPVDIVFYSLLVK